MTDSLLSALSAAKNEDERARAFLQSIFQGLDEGLPDFLIMAAIPHRFDEPLLAALEANPTENTALKLRKIVALGYASLGREGLFRLSDGTRNVLLKHAYSQDQARFFLLNRRAAAHLASLERDDATRYTEFVYHAVLEGSESSASPANVVKLIGTTFPAWGGSPNFATITADAIPKLIAEHFEAGRLTGSVPTTSEIWHAMLKPNSGEAIVALALEGTGALCAYHAGVYQALHEAGVEPDWIAGESMGAMVGAVIAGNAPERRLDALNALWKTFAQPAWPSMALPWPMSDWLAVTSGVPGLYAPSLQGPLLGGSAFYDLSPARATLEQYVDFDRINDRKIRFAVSAVNVATGNFTYFDNAHHRISPEHILASMALPPAFPAVQVAGTSYWDASLVASTALQHVLDGSGDHALIVFQPYFFALSDRMPRTLNEITAKQRAISFSSRARLIANYYAQIQFMRNRLKSAIQRLPEEQRTEEDKSLLKSLASQPRVSLVNLAYRRQESDIDYAPHNFAQDAIEQHWSHGRLDTQRALGSEMLSPMHDDDSGIAIYNEGMRRDQNQPPEP